jgi:hypothetical protein
MANVLTLATQQNLPAGWISGVAAGGNLVDRNAVRVYEREKLIRYSITLSGNYATHVRGANTGEVINLGAAFVPAAYQADQYWGYRGPARVYILTPGTTGYGMTICPGLDAFHWLLVIYSTVTGELAAGAYPAGLIADLDIVIEASGLAFD